MKLTLQIPSLTLSAVALALLTNCGPAPDDTSTPPSPPVETPASPVPPKGHTEAPKAEADADVDYMVKLGILKARLIAGQELSNGGKAELAEPLLGQAAQQVYSELESQLTDRKVPEFKTALTDLHGLVKSQPKDTKVPAAFETAMQGIEKAIAVIPAAKLQSPEFVLPVVVGLLNTAASEYKGAIADGKITPLGYQTAHGLVLYTNNLYGSIAEPMTKDHPEANEAIVKALAQLEIAWPDAVPPEKPMKTPEEVETLVNAIAENSKKIAK
jgi:hypothetical protein